MACCPVPEKIFRVPEDDVRLRRWAQDMGGPRVGLWLTVQVVFV
jgi:hypothetical protein